jgi:hypothetical protein
LDARHDAVVDDEPALITRDLAVDGEELDIRAALGAQLDVEGDVVAQAG